MAAQKQLPIFVFDDEVRERCVGRGCRGSGQGAQAQGSPWESHVLLSAPFAEQSLLAHCLQEGCTQCTQQWHYFDDASGRLVPLAGDSAESALALEQAQPAAAAHPLLPPPLPQAFAGVGTRSLGPAGLQAIRQLYEATYARAGVSGAGN